jgi:hypothetical protein
MPEHSNPRQGIAGMRAHQVDSALWSDCSSLMAWRSRSQDLKQAEEDYGAVGQLGRHGGHCDGLVGKLLNFVSERCVEFNSELSLHHHTLRFVQSISKSLFKSLGILLTSYQMKFIIVIQQDLIFRNFKLLRLTVPSPLAAWGA